MTTCDNDQFGCLDCACATTSNAVCFEVPENTYEGSAIVTLGAFEQLTSCGMLSPDQCGIYGGKRCYSSRETCSVYTGSYVVDNVLGQGHWSQTFEVADKHFLTITNFSFDSLFIIPTSSVFIRYTRPVGFFGEGDNTVRGLPNYDNQDCDGSFPAGPFGTQCGPGFETKIYRVATFDDSSPEAGKTVCLYEEYRQGLFTQEGIDAYFSPIWRACYTPSWYSCCPVSHVHRDPNGYLCEPPPSITVQYL